jgi:hypothetical protein
VSLCALLFSFAAIIVPVKRIRSLFFCAHPKFIPILPVLVAERSRVLTAKDIAVTQYSTNEQIPFTIYELGSVGFIEGPREIKVLGLAGTDNAVANALDCHLQSRVTDPRVSRRRVEIKVKSWSPSNIAESYVYCILSGSVLGHFKPANNYVGSLLHMEIADDGLQGESRITSSGLLSGRLRLHLTQGLLERFFAVTDGSPSQASLISSYTSIDGSGAEGKPSSKGKPLLKVIVFLLIGLSVSFYAFWNMQFGTKDWRILLLLLVSCFLLIAYGTYLFLDSQECRAETAQFSEYSLTQYKNVGTHLKA